MLSRSCSSKKTSCLKMTALITHTHMHPPTHAHTHAHPHTLMRTLDTLTLHTLTCTLTHCTPLHTVHPYTHTVHPYTHTVHPHTLTLHTLTPTHCTPSHPHTAHPHRQKVTLWQHADELEQEQIAMGTWINDKAVTECMACGTAFTVFHRKVSSLE